jgi:hypothetical protein
VILKRSRSGSLLLLHKLVMQALCKRKLGVQVLSAAPLIPVIESWSRDGRGKPVRLAGNGREQGMSERVKERRKG